jgi:hypothetical protein
MSFIVRDNETISIWSAFGYCAAAKIDFEAPWPSQYGLDLGDFLLHFYEDHSSWEVCFFSAFGREGWDGGYC